MSTLTVELIDTSTGKMVTGTANFTVKGVVTVTNPGNQTSTVGQKI